MFCAVLYASFQALGSRLCGGGWIEVRVILVHSAFGYVFLRIHDFGASAVWHAVWSSYPTAFCKNASLGGDSLVFGAAIGAVGMPVEVSVVPALVSYCFAVLALDGP